MLTNRHHAPRQAQRRACIRLMGGGVLWVPLAAATLAACSDREAAGTADASSDAASPAATDPRLRWLALAAWAPSAHNMQPWMVDLREAPDTLVLHTDPQRLLPAIDPDRRQTTVSLGAFVELLCMAAQADGQTCEIALFPEGEALASPVARIRMRPADPALAPDPLFPYVRRRRTDRAIYLANRPVSDAALTALLATASCHGIVAGGTVQTQKVLRLDEQAAQAWRISLTDPDAMLETLRVTRVGRREIEAHRDGIAVHGFWPALAEKVGLFPRDKVPAADSTAMNTMRQLGEDQAHSAAGWVWLVSAGNDRARQIAAGRAFVRLHLEATRQGVALQPMSQALEAYPEAVARTGALYADLELDRAQHSLQMLARIGHAQDEPPASVRRGVDDFVSA